VRYRKEREKLCRRLDNLQGQAILMRIASGGVSHSWSDQAADTGIRMERALPLEAQGSGSSWTRPEYLSYIRLIGFRPSLAVEVPPNSRYVFRSNAASVESCSRIRSHSVEWIGVCV
jgi:hypothetical protein